MRYLLEVASRALPGREEEYDRWYGDVHVGEVLALPGFETCARYRRADGTGLLAHYAVETNDPAALLQSLFDATPTFRMTDAIDVESVRFAFLQPIDA